MSKITQLTEATNPSSGDDLVEIVIDTATTPLSRKMKFLNLLRRVFLGDGTQLTITTIADGEFLKRSGTNILGASPGGGGLGDVVGPASATDNAVVRYNTTTGKVVQDSNLTIADDAVATEVGYINIPQFSYSVDHTAVVGERGGHLFHPSSDNSPRTFTIPANSSVPFAIGTALTFVNKINTLTIAINTDTLTWSEDSSTGSRSLAPNGMATALKITSTEWLISGTGLS